MLSHATLHLNCRINVAAKFFAFRNVIICTGTHKSQGHKSLNWVRDMSPEPLSSCYLWVVVVVLGRPTDICVL